MTIRKNAFPETVSQPVRDLITEFYRLSNAASKHTDHDAGSIACRSNRYFVLLISHFIDEKAFSELFTEDGMYEFAEVQNKGRASTLCFSREPIIQRYLYNLHFVI